MDTKEESKARRVWLAELGTKAPKTQANYLRYFQMFLDRFEVSPDELYDMRLSDLKSDDPRDHKRIEGMVKTLMAEMQRGGSAAQTARMVQKSTKSFFEAQGLELKFKAKDRPKGASNGQRLVMHEHIAEMHDVAARALEHKVRNRALLIFAKDAGLRISDIAALDVRNYVDAKDLWNEDGEHFKEFQPTATKKTGSLAHIMIGPEATKHIGDYLHERGDPAPNEPLFLMENGDRVTSASLTQIFRRMAKHLGKDGIKRSAHSMRKFHQTMCESFMSKNWVAKLQGRTISDSTREYSQPELMPGELARAYIAGYEKLRVLSGEGVERDRRVRDLTNEVKGLRQERDQAIADLESKVEALQESINAGESRNILLERRLQANWLKHLESLSREERIETLDRVASEQIEKLERDLGLEQDPRTRIVIEGHIRNLRSGDRSMFLVNPSEIGAPVK